MGIRVLHIIPSVAPCRGGPSKAVVEMVAALNQTGVDAEIATTNDNCDELLDVPTSSKHPYQGAPTWFFPRWSPPLKALREFQYSAEFKHWLDQQIQDYDVLHIHAIFSYTCSYAMWLARKRDIPYVIRPIGQLETWAMRQGRLKKLLYLAAIERQNLRGAAALHFTAESEQQQAQHRFDLRNPQVIPLGITPPNVLEDARSELRAHYSLTADAPVLVYLARLHPKKGLELLLEALSEVTSPVSLLIAGDGDENYVRHLNDLVDQLNLSASVVFTGFVQGRQRDLLLQGADLFTLTSYSENFGIAVLEALAGGTPCLVTSGVALSKEVQRNDLGYVAEPEVPAIKTQLQRALKELNTRPDRRRQIQQTIAERYHWPTIADQISELYTEIRK